MSCPEGKNGGELVQLLVYHEVVWGQDAISFFSLAICSSPESWPPGHKNVRTRRASHSPNNTVLHVALGRASPAPFLGNTVELDLMAEAWVSQRV